MQHSEQINEIATALAKAQASIKCASKDSTNPYYGSQYADLASVWDACREALSSNGLAVIQTNHSERDENGTFGLYISTMLTHTSGQWIRDTCEIPLSKNDAQGVGSAITYGRRYALAAMVGVAPADDDGEAAVARDKDGEAKEAPKRKPRTTANKTTPLHVANARHAFETYCGKLADAANRSVAGVQKEEAARWKSEFEIATLDDLTEKQASQFIDALDVEMEKLQEPVNA